MSEMITLEAKLRETTGKSYCRKVRKRGWLPGVIVAKGESIHIEINHHELPKAMRNDKQCTLDFGDSQKHVRVQEVQLDPAKRTPLHVDFIPVS